MGPAPSASTALALKLCCHMGNQRRNCTFFNQLYLKNNWTHMVLPHLCFFMVNFTNPSRGHAWSQVSLFSPPARAPFAAPYPRSLLTDVLQGPLQFLLQEDLDPSSWHKAQPDPGLRAGSNTGPSAAPGKLVWVTWLWVKVREQEILNKNCPCSCLPLPS